MLVVTEAMLRRRWSELADRHKTGDDLIIEKLKLDMYRMFLFSSPDIFKAIDGHNDVIF